MTHSEELAKAVVPIMEGQLEKISEKRRSFIETNYSTYGGIILTDSLEESIAFVNEYAPEHMEVMCKNPVRHPAENQKCGRDPVGRV